LNRIERVVDRFDPGLSVRLRTMKMRLRHDIDWQLVRDMMRPCDVGVDVGANRGAYTYLMSVMAGPGGHVHAVEPFPGNGERLRRLARRRGNITVHALAASDHAGRGVLRIPVRHGHRIDALATLEPNRPPNGDSLHQDSLHQDSCVVSLRTLDELLDGERPVSFIKCDVEGHEQQVLRGAAGLIGRDRPSVFVEVEQRHRQDPIDATFSFFAAAGYRGWFVAAGRLRPLEEFDIARDQLDFLDGGFVPYEMPAGYVSDFLFCPRDAALATGP
jgi:FkbM family methyltransferase